MSKRLGLVMCGVLWAGVCPAQPTTYTDGQTVEVREGDIWSPATIVQKEGCFHCRAHPA
jgi:hypothetical protein